MPSFDSVLVANRGEIAVRIVRACKDAGLRSIAVYAEPDRDAPFVSLADEAYALGGATAADTYLSIDKILDVAAGRRREAIHPGYGFLAENSSFAGGNRRGNRVDRPIPSGHRRARRQGLRPAYRPARGRPLVPGTPDPVTSADEVLAFAKEHGLPVAIKAAFGGGGRGLKVARAMEDIVEQFESAVREATAAFGRGECFVERFLDKPRHVETQCLADSHGNVVVVSTRDCSLQRRHQKLVEEAPAPFLTDSQNAELVRASRRSCERPL